VNLGWPVYPWFSVFIVVPFDTGYHLPCLSPASSVKMNFRVIKKFLLTAKVIKGGSEETASVVTEILFQNFLLIFIGDF